MKVITAEDTRREHRPGAEARTTGSRPVERSLQTLTGPGPWHTGETVVAAVLGLLGTAGVVWCWYESSDELSWRDQGKWLAGAAPCTVLVVLAGVWWVAIGMRRVRRGFRALALARSAAFALDQPAAEVSVAALLASTPGLVTAETMTRAHRPDCLLMRGKTAIEVPVDAEHEYVRCGVCA